MAKIYETQQDYRRDQLTEQTHLQRNVANAHFSLATVLSMGGAIVSMSNSMREKASRWSTWLSVGMVGLGLVEFFNGLRSGNKVQTLKRARERLGQETVILPPGVAAAPETECAPCKMKTHTEGKTRRTPMDFAESSDITVNR